MVDLGILFLRLVGGGLLAGHGAQKLFGSFEGPGLDGTAGMLESMGMRPGKPWATAAGMSEFGGGLLTLLGLFNPLGPISLIAVMIMATVKAHWGKPIWAMQGGAELPLINIAIAAALIAIGPGKYALDEALGIRLPRWLAILAVVVAAAGIALGLLGGEQAPTGQQEQDGQVSQDQGTGAHN